MFYTITCNLINLVCRRTRMTVPLLKKREKSSAENKPIESQVSSEPEVDQSTCTIQTCVSISPDSISTNEGEVNNQDARISRVRLVCKFSVRTFSSRAHMKCEPTGLCVTDQVN